MPEKGYDICEELAEENERLRETLYEVANRAANFMDADAASWMPSIYKLSCDAVAEDPWPLLEANGWSREKLTVGNGQSREQAMQELADQAQALDMGYGQSQKPES